MSEHELEIECEGFVWVMTEDDFIIRKDDVEIAIPAEIWARMYAKVELIKTQSIVDSNDRFNGTLGFER